MTPEPEADNDMASTIPVRLLVNGENHNVEVEARCTLVDALRDSCGLTGTHVGCEHGICGACTVLIDQQPVRSCLIFAVQCENVSIRTVEGLAPSGVKLHPLQEAFWDNHGLQCGFCTPGFLMLAVSYLEKSPRPGRDELLELLASNLCRCTGYQSIIDSVLAAQESLER